MLLLTALRSTRCLSRQDFYARLLGSLELCVVPMTFESPLSAYCAALSSAPRAEQLAGLDALRPIVEAVSRRTGVRLDARGELQRARGSARRAAALAYDSSDDEASLPQCGGTAPALPACGMPACGLRGGARAAPRAGGKSGSGGAEAGRDESPRSHEAACAAALAGGPAPRSPAGAPAADTPAADAAAEAPAADADAAAFSCFTCDTLCGPRTAGGAPDAAAGDDSFGAWASDVGAFAAQVVSTALCAGSTVVMPAYACPAYACRPQRAGILEALRSGVAAGGAGGIATAGMGAGAAVAAAAAAAAGPGPGDSAASVISGVRWGDAPERVCGALATLAPALFAEVAGVAVAPLASTLNHSCVPSCQLETAPGGVITAVTLHDVAPGEELTIAYTATAAPLATRRAELAKHAFECACARCVLEAEGAGELAAADVHALARQAQEEGRYADAEALLRGLMARPALTPGALPDAEAAHALGVCLLARGRWQEAHAVWAQATRLAPAHPALKAQAYKESCYWPSEGAPSQVSLRDAAVAHSEEDIYVIQLGAQPNEMAMVTSAPLLAPDDCARAVAAAEAEAAKRGGWTTARHYSVPTTDLPLHEVPALLAWFNDTMRTSIAPLLMAAFPAIRSPGQLRVHDAFIVRYSAAQQRHLPVHRDQSMYSLTVALNARSEFTGGGTFFADCRTVICPDVGHVVAFPGDTWHGGEPITAGVRYIIACFLFLGPDDGAVGGASDMQDATEF